MKKQIFKIFLAVAVCFVLSAVAISCDDEASNGGLSLLDAESSIAQNSGSDGEQTTDTSSSEDVSTRTTGTTFSDNSDEDKWSQDYK